MELIPASQIKGFHAPDIMLQGVPWEMKAPQGGGKNTIKNTVQNASHQSENIILDLRRCKIPQDKEVKEAEQKLKLSKRLRRMKIVAEGEKIFDFSK